MRLRTCRHRFDSKFRKCSCAPRNGWTVAVPRVREASGTAAGRDGPGAAGDPIAPAVPTQRAPGVGERRSVLAPLHAATPGLARAAEADEREERSGTRASAVPSELPGRWREAGSIGRVHTAPTGAGRGQEARGGSTRETAREGRHFRAATTTLTAALARSTPLPFPAGRPSADSSVTTVPRNHFRFRRLTARQVAPSALADRRRGTRYHRARYDTRART